MTLALDPMLRSLVHPVVTSLPPGGLVERLQGEPGVVLLQSARLDPHQARYSFVTARPFLTFRSRGSGCELVSRNGSRPQFGNPWHLLDALMARYELLDDLDHPFPLGGCFGYWGYDLKNFVEPKLRPRAVNDLEWPDCHVGFYDSLVVFDHFLSQSWIVSTGLDVDGSRDAGRAEERLAWWSERLADSATSPGCHRAPSASESASEALAANRTHRARGAVAPLVESTFSRPGFLATVENARRYIRAGHIYQVNLSQRLSAPTALTGWEFYQELTGRSPAPFAAWLDCGDFQLVSSSPELFLRLSGNQAVTRPIKGTRPRSVDPDQDARLSYELQTSAKEMAELVMITDLLRNDLGRVCDYGTIQVPELARLERYAHVQHLVSTVEGRLRPGVTHFAAFAACFPGGSITGAPKFRAMEIIDELEPVTRGPYTGALGYLGFNRESQLSITIRAGVYRANTVHFHVGAGIVADSQPAAEYDETLAKAAGFFAALGLSGPRVQPAPTAPAAGPLVADCTPPSHP